MSRAARAVWIAALLGAAGLAADGWRTEPDPRVLDHYRRDIRELQALDARIDGQVMQSRQALVAHYDGIVQTMTDTNTVLARLERVEDLEGPADRERVVSGLGALRASLAEKAALVESFKSENAILRNSVRYFPIAAKRLRDELAASPETQRLAADVNDVLVSVLELNETPSSEEAWSRAQSSIDTLSVLVVPLGMEEDFEVVLRHAQTVVDRGVRVDAMTADILAVPSASDAVAVDTALERAMRDAYRRADHRKIVLFVTLLGAVVGLSVDIILRLRRSAAQERKATARLAEANEILVREKERERELLELKSRFISMTSHEFRTPLAVILSSTELLEAYGERWTPAKRADHFARIKDATAGMEQMLDSILVIGKSDSGKLEYNPVRLDLARWTHHLVDAFRPTLTKSHSLEASIDAALAEACVDEKLLNHIVTNLLSNAVKYSPAGGVVRFAVKRDGDRAVFVVTDDGIGIPAQDQPMLFDSFHRCSNVGHIRGTGLGLAVVKRAIEAHRGELHLASDVGRGTTFTVSIPLGALHELVE
ncbi:MAG: HAMP domain-containing histidine kinase [Polyangiaceae bacterium]|nr:HAMP domain-containing histidine kinase [Polyangiaceae bacterium]